MAVYRNLAAELGLVPKYQRDALWRQLKLELRRLIEQQSVVQILVIDEAQHRCDDIFEDLSGFLNDAFDRSTLLKV